MQRDQTQSSSKPSSPPDKELASYSSFASFSVYFEHMVMLGKCLSIALNAKIIGSGTEAIVLAHGFGGDQSLWDKILPYLAQHYKVLVFDWPFSGAIKDPSMFDPVKHSSYDGFANDLIGLIDEMNMQQVVFVGHSMSGMIGCIASVKRPELFKSLVLVGASPRYANIDDYEGGFGDSEINELISNIEHNFDKWAPYFASLVVDPNDPSSVTKFEQSLTKMRHDVAHSLAKTVFSCDERAILGKVSTSCTIIQTSNDIVVPNSVAYYMEKMIKGSKLEIIDTYGHFPQLTAHVQFLDVLGGVLDSKCSL